MRYRYSICDVFTDTRFGGNQLAVLPDADGLSPTQMQQIAREFNFSETTFVLPAERGHSRRVRIFTPTTEVPFAGHPNVGTAFVLAATGELGPLEGPTTVTFEEEAGLVPVSIERRAGQLIWCELSAPSVLSVGQTMSAEAVASALSLDASDIDVRCHTPQVASVGLPFLFARVTGRAALERARPVVDELEAIASAGVTPDVFVYALSEDEFDVRARMFAPLDGVPEDPATGSASCALAGLLSDFDEQRTGDFRWRIAQGVEMGRPSVLEVRAEKRDGVVAATFVGGSSVLVADGHIEVG